MGASDMVNASRIAMSSVTELACLLSSALDGEPDGAAVAALLDQLAGLLEQSESAALELDELLFDLHAALVAAAALPPAEPGVRQLLAVAAQQCTAREVFTLGMATLAQQLSYRHGAGVPPAAHGPASPSFQLYLLATLGQCLPRIRRRPLHFLAELLHMQLRWAAEVLPGVPLGNGHAGAAICIGSDAAAGPAAAAPAVPAPGAAVTVTDAVQCLAVLAASTAHWAQQAEQQLSAAEQKAAAELLGAALLQLASIVLQLPHVLEAAAADVAAAAASGGAPRLGSRFPAMRAAADGLAGLLLALLRQVPAPGAGAPGSGCSPEQLQQVAAAAGMDQLAGSGLDPADLAYFSASEAAEGAAVAACAAAWEPGTPPQLLAARLRQLLPGAACLLLDMGAQHQSVALTLLPLGALCTAAGQVATAADACQLDASSAALDSLLSALVAVMSHNPVQLVRSCTHDAVHALLDAFQPAARLAQLDAMSQMPSTTAAVVALQRLRQEMAAAWAAAAPVETEAAAEQQEGGEASVWLSPRALQLALPCLERGTERGWHDEASVLRQADVQAAALSLLRWVLLREAAAPRGVLPPAQARSLLEQDLLPLQACMLRLLQMQASSLGGSGASSSGAGSGFAAQEQQQQQLVRQAQLDGFLAAQRLHEALGCVINLIEEKGS